MGEYLQKRLREFADHPLVGEVRGAGLIAAIELVANKTTRQAFEGGDVGKFVQQACQDNGLIIRVMAGSTVAFCPPLIINQAQVDELIEKMSSALEQTLDFVTRGNLLLA
jgi:adenosylmethionine-8-amino-7-oxononanoate aminotransferase